MAQQMPQLGYRPKQPRQPHVLEDAVDGALTPRLWAVLKEYTDSTTADRAYLASLCKQGGYSPEKLARLVTGMSSYPGIEDVTLALSNPDSGELVVTAEYKGYVWRSPAEFFSAMIRATRIDFFRSGGRGREYYAWADAGQYPPKEIKVEIHHPVE